jgi:hypothetical protein
VFASSAAGQDRLRTFEDLTRALPQAVAPTSREVRIRWTTLGSSGDTDSRLRVRAARRVDAALTRDRRPEVSSNSVVVVTLDAAGRELDWRAMLDPRVLRDESTPPHGPDKGRVHLRADTELLVSIPDVPGAVRLRIYVVRPVDGRAALEEVGTVDLPADRQP